MVAEKLGQGKENAKITIKENPEMMAEIESKIKRGIRFWRRSCRR